jgi:hypothetical protein
MEVRRAFRAWPLAWPSPSGPQGRRWLRAQGDERFAAVRTPFARNLDSGEELAASFLMNKMGPGTIGSERSAEYATAISRLATSAPVSRYRSS